MAKAGKEWKKSRAKSCAHYIGKKNADLLLYILKSEAQPDCYFVISETTGSDDPELNYLTSEEILDRFGISI